MLVFVLTTTGFAMLVMTVVCATAVSSCLEEEDFAQAKLAGAMSTGAALAAAALFVAIGWILGGGA